MRKIRVNGEDYSSSLDETELAFIGPLSLPTGINSLSKGIVKHEEDISELNSNMNNLKNIKTLTVNHGTINAGQSSTIIETSLKTINIIVCSVSVSGSYNSDCIPWSYYGSSNGFISRVKNTGTNQATNISVTYTYIEVG